MQRDLAYLRLKQLLDIPADQPIHLDIVLEADRLEVPEPFASEYRDTEARISASRILNAADHATVQAAAALVSRQEARVRAVEAERRPNLSFISDYGNVTYPSNIFIGFGDIRTNWTIGAFLRVPILTGGRQRANEAIAYAQLASDRAQYKLIRELAALDTKTAWAEAEAALSTWEASTSTVLLARRAYDIADVRYRAGISTLLELSDARLQLQQAETNRAQTARDRQVARSRVCLKSFGWPRSRFRGRVETRPDPSFPAL
jgi:outer membrane protein TolC